MGACGKFPCRAADRRGERNRQIWPDSGLEAGAWRLSSGVGGSAEAGRSDSAEFPVRSSQHVC
ncbi:MAG TPA: hypothetical protein DCR20_01070 [Planctomycetaceae bacterium]|nr:hypothetical protein [Planctomycetaceae bacterium]